MSQSLYSLVIVKPALLFTATGQISAAVALGNVTASGASLGGSWNRGLLTVTGTALATATLAVMGSADGGLTFFPLPISAVATPGTSATTITATAAGMYQVPLTGITHLQIVTSGTFTATNVSVTLTLSPNPQGGTGGGSATPAGPAGGVLAGTYPNPTLNTTQAQAVTWNGAQTFAGTASANAIFTQQLGAITTANGNLALAATGATFSRTAADANPTWTFNNNGGTGDIVVYQFASAVKSKIGSTGLFGMTVGAAIASAATIAPTAGIQHVTGTTAIATITPPAPFSGTIGGTIYLIADGLASTTTAGNIANAVVFVVGTVYACTWDGTKWYIK